MTQAPSALPPLLRQPQLAAPQPGPPFRTTAELAAAGRASELSLLASNGGVVAVPDSDSLAYLIWRLYFRLGLPTRAPSLPQKQHVPAPAATASSSSPSFAAANETTPSSTSGRGLIVLEPGRVRSSSTGSSDTGSTAGRDAEVEVDDVSGTQQGAKRRRLYASGSSLASQSSAIAFSTATAAAPASAPAFVTSKSNGHFVIRPCRSVARTEMKQSLTELQALKQSIGRGEPYWPLALRRGAASRISSSANPQWREALLDGYCRWLSSISRLHPGIAQHLLQQERTSAVIAALAVDATRSVAMTNVRGNAASAEGGTVTQSSVGSGSTSTHKSISRSNDRSKASSSFKAATATVADASSVSAEAVRMPALLASSAAPSAGASVPVVAVPAAVVTASALAGSTLQSSGQPFTTSSAALADDNLLRMTVASRPKDTRPPLAAAAPAVVAATATNSGLSTQIFNSAAAQPPAPSSSASSTATLTAAMNVEATAPAAATTTCPRGRANSRGSGRSSATSSHSDSNPPPELVLSRRLRRLSSTTDRLWFQRLVLLMLKRLPDPLTSVPADVITSESLHSLAREEAHGCAPPPSGCGYDGEVKRSTSSSSASSSASAFSSASSSSRSSAPDVISSAASFVLLLRERLAGVADDLAKPEGSAAGSVDGPSSSSGSSRGSTGKRHSESSPNAGDSASVDLTTLSELQADLLGALTLEHLGPDFEQLCNKALDGLPSPTQLPRPVGEKWGMQQQSASAAAEALSGEAASVSNGRAVLATLQPSSDNAAADVASHAPSGSTTESSVDDVAKAPHDEAMSQLTGAPEAAPAQAVSAAPAAVAVSSVMLVDKPATSADGTTSHPSGGGSVKLQSLPSSEIVSVPSTSVGTTDTGCAIVLTAGFEARQDLGAAESSSSSSSAAPVAVVAEVSASTPVVSAPVPTTVATVQPSSAAPIASVPNSIAVGPAWGLPLSQSQVAAVVPRIGAMPHSTHPSIGEAYSATIAAADAAAAAAARRRLGVPTSAAAAGIVFLPPSATAAVAGKPVATRPIADGPLTQAHAPVAPVTHAAPSYSPSSVVPQQPPGSAIAVSTATRARQLAWRRAIAVAAILHGGIVDCLATPGHSSVSVTEAAMPSPQASPLLLLPASASSSSNAKTSPAATTATVAKKGVTTSPPALNLADASVKPSRPPAVAPASATAQSSGADVVVLSEPHTSAPTGPSSTVKPANVAAGDSTSAASTSTSSDAAADAAAPSTTGASSTSEATADATTTAEWTEAEDGMIVSLVKEHGCDWDVVAPRFAPRRSTDDVEQR